MEAARWAPSSKNEQPWRYIVFTKDNPEKLIEAQSVLLESNVYAKRAPILICAIAKKNYSEGEKYNRLHFHDLGAANENMFLEAFNQGLIMHEMGGFDVQRAIEVFHIPDDFEIGIMIAIGYQDKHSVLPERFREKAFSPTRKEEALRDSIYRRNWEKSGMISVIASESMCLVTDRVKDKTIVELDCKPNRIGFLP